MSCIQCWHSPRCMHAMHLLDADICCTHMHTDCTTKSMKSIIVIAAYKHAHATCTHMCQYPGGCLQQLRGIPLRPMDTECVLLHAHLCCTHMHTDCTTDSQEYPYNSRVHCLTSMHVLLLTACTLLDACMPCTCCMHIYAADKCLPIAGQ